jgi:hypothetical protein
MKHHEKIERAASNYNVKLFLKHIKLCDQIVAEGGVDKYYWNWRPFRKIVSCLVGRCDLCSYRGETYEKAIQMLNVLIDRGTSPNPDDFYDDNDRMYFETLVRRRKLEMI